MEWRDRRLNRFSKGGKEFGVEAILVTERYTQIQLKYEALIFAYF